MSRNLDLLAEIEREPDNAEKAPLQVRPPQMFGAPFVSDSSGDDTEAEMSRFVHNVFLANNGSSPKQVVFCGVNDGDDSSSVCAAAARALAARTSKAVCLMDANRSLRRLSHVLDAHKTISFTPKSQSPHEGCADMGKNLWLADSASHTDSRGVLLSLDQLRQQLELLNKTFEYILIDAPPTSTSGDVAILGQVVDAAILVIEAGRTRRLNAGKAKELFEASGVPLTGVVLRNRAFPIPERLYRWL